MPIPSPMTLEEIRLLPAGEAIVQLDIYLTAHPDSDDALTLRGMRHWALSRRALAINDYLAAIRINPASKAAEALRAANEILDFRNTDLLNP